MPPVAPVPPKTQTFILFFVKSGAIWSFEPAVAVAVLGSSHILGVGGDLVAPDRTALGGIVRVIRDRP
ncbi:MAG TPA: hypothetical protein VEJ19_01825 [Nitrososphaerales archaeon]|nr:hypothetical protein [Nitrososphaerales archaeon]